MASYLWIALLTLAVGLWASLGGRGPTQAVPWFMFTVAILASLYGVRVGLLVGIGVGAVLFRTGGLSLEGAVILLLSAWLAHGVGQSLRRAHRRAKLLAQLQGVLADSLEQIRQAREGRAVLMVLLQGVDTLLGHSRVALFEAKAEGYGLVVSNEAFIPSLVSQGGLVDQAYREKLPVVVRSKTKPASPIQGAFPLLVDGQVRAVVYLERPKPLQPEEREALGRLLGAVGQELARREEAWLQQSLTGLSLRLQSSPELVGLAEAALAYLRPAVRMEMGCIWEVQGSRMVPLLYQGPQGFDLPELAYGQGLVWQVYWRQAPVYVERYQEASQPHPFYHSRGLASMVALPLSLQGSPRARWVLDLGSLSPRAFTPAEQRLLTLAGQVLSLALAERLEKARQQAITRLFLELLREGPTPGFLQQVLEVAARWIPGSEAGSLLVWDAPTRRYLYAAALGYDLEALQRTYVAQESVWYGLDRQSLLQGKPRIISAEETSILERSRQSGAGVGEQEGRLGEIQANLCLPLPYGQEVLAYLNLDNLHDPRAFGEDSLEAAQLFAPLLASLLQGMQTRAQLEAAALTDALTGLPNRRAFDQALAHLVAQAERHGQPFSLLVMDMSGFKTINDRLGHARGDEALVQVAQTLKQTCRNGDMIFRWGGDEFAALLPQTNRAGALAAARRKAQAIQQICIEGLCLGANIGLACYPEEAQSTDALLSLADARMYRAKAARLPVLGEEGG